MDILDGWNKILESNHTIVASAKSLKARQIIVDVIKPLLREGIYFVVNHLKRDWNPEGHVIVAFCLPIEHVSS